MVKPNVGELDTVANLDGIAVAKLDTSVIAVVGLRLQRVLGVVGTYTRVDKGHRETEVSMMHPTTLVESPQRKPEAKIPANTISVSSSPRRKKANFH